MDLNICAVLKRNYPIFHLVPQNGVEVLAQIPNVPPNVVPLTVTVRKVNAVGQLIIA